MIPKGYITDTQGCIISNPDNYAKATWSGNVINRYAWGKGQLTWYDKNDNILATYDGSMSKGLYHGKGTLWTTNGSYSGEWIEGIFQGRASNNTGRLLGFLQKLKLA